MNKHGTGQDEAEVYTPTSEERGEYALQIGPILEVPPVTMTDANDLLAALAARFERNAADARQEALDPDVRALYGAGFMNGMETAWRHAAVEVKKAMGDPEPYTVYSDMTQERDEPYAPYADLTPLEAWNADGNR